MKKSEIPTPFGYELKPKTKSAHYHLLLVPDVLDLLRELAARENTSVNQLCNDAIMQLLKERGMIPDE